MLPADVENLRTANVALAQQVHELKAEKTKLDAKIRAAGHLLEQISVWMWKNKIKQPDLAWSAEYISVCQMFEPEYKHE